ncbi:transcriptional regulator NrdR [Candidatus Pacearchaeota archaeon CG10_big_fil_rev_8_21_14_0_10_34_12]|nr:MAG: transcriptional regulator NrdR [Candidatus Pacearchaeota archaeon CG10_big_fil_rev_8_21_14_0_10_34_12]
MKCPYCSHKDTRVTNKRPYNEGEGVRRRRECLKCKKRFTTHENIASENNFYVIKKDKRREKFDKEKLERGVEKAFEKRPVSKEKVDKMINEITESLRKKGKKEIQSSVIGELVMKKMKKLDNVAYIRFASVYQDFQNVGDFKKELRGLKE